MAEVERDMTMKRPTLVFGAGGQLGRDLVRCAGEGVPLVARSRTDADIADADVVRRTLQEIAPALVVNAAAYTAVDAAESHPDEAERGNSIGPGILARECAATGVPLVHISTDYVFDGSKPAPYVEDDPIAPLGIYGRSKAAGEAAVRKAHERHVILRTAWVYGIFGRNFLKTVLRLARERDELRIVADQRGCPTSTRDLAQAILRIAPRLADGDSVWGTYHFAGDGVTTWHGFASRVVERFAVAAGRKPLVVPIGTVDYPTPARRPANSALDCTRFESMFEFKGRAWQDEVDATADALIAGGGPD